MGVSIIVFTQNNFEICLGLYGLPLQFLSYTSTKSENYTWWITVFFPTGEFLVKQEPKRVLEFLRFF